MVARISSGAQPAGAVYYNELKVEQGQAERLALRNFRGVQASVEQIKTGQIVSKLEEQAAGNTRISKPTFHASLSLAKNEKPSADELLDMADRYMIGMGYGQQPYVVYQHHDTDHAHIHIVTVRVDDEGKKVPDKFERERSNTLRQQIEKEFNLVIAEQVSLKPDRQQLRPLEYGTGDLRRDLSTIVQGVLSDFRFSSFTQFNQLLAIYNVQAVQIEVEGKKTGLVYSAIGADGKPQGAPFKSSRLPNQPTLETVNRRMNAGKKLKGDNAVGLRKVAQEQLTQSKNWDEFQQKLSAARIEVIPHRGTDGNLFGISFIDVRNGTKPAIYTGSELGKSFTAGSLKQTLGEHYQPPSERKPAPEPAPRQQVKPEGISTESTKKPEQQQAPARPEQEAVPHVHNLDAIRQLLYAIGQEGLSQDPEQDLKKMFKKARQHKPRLS